MVSTMEESWATDAVVKPPSLTLQSLTVPDDNHHDDDNDNNNNGGESSHWQSSAQGSQQQPSFHASHTSSFQGSITMNTDDYNNASHSSQPRKGKRRTKVFKNLKNMLRSTTTTTTSTSTNKNHNNHNKGDEDEEAAAAPDVVPDVEKPSSLTDLTVPERPPLSPRKKTLKQRFSILRPSLAPNPVQFNPNEPYPHLDPTIVDGTDSGTGTDTVVTGMSPMGSPMVSLEGATTTTATTTTTTTTTKSELAPPTPQKKKNKLIRPFISLPRRSESLPIRASQQKEKVARRQARQDILGRIGGALGESTAAATSSSMNRSRTSVGDSGAFLVEAMDASSGDVFVSTTSSANNNASISHTTNNNNNNDSFVMDASERTTGGGGGGGGRFARVRAMVKRNSLFQARSKTDTAPLVMLDDPSSEFSVELKPNDVGGDDELSHQDDLEDDDEDDEDHDATKQGLARQDIPLPPELPRPSLEIHQSGQGPHLNQDREMPGQEDDEDTRTLNEPPTSSLDKVENSITERRRTRRQHHHHHHHHSQQSSTSPAAARDGHSDSKNSPRRGRVGPRRQSRSHPEDDTHKSDSASPGSQSPSSLHRRLRPRTSRSNPTTSDRPSEHQRSSKDDPQTPSRRRMRKVVDTRASSTTPRADEKDRTKEEDGVLVGDDSSVGDPQTPTRRRARRHDPSNGNSNSITSSTKSKSTDERDNDHHEGKNSSIGDLDSSARRSSQDPLTVRRRLKQQSSSGSRNNHPEDDISSKSPSKYGGRESVSSRKSQSPTRNQDNDRSLSPPNPGGEKPDSDRSPKPSREKSKDSSGRSRQRRKSPSKQVGTSQTSSESQDQREKRSKSPQKDDRRSKSPLQKDKGHEETRSRNDMVRSSSPSKSINKDSQSSKTAPEKSNSNESTKSRENGVESSRSRQRSGSPGRSHGRSPASRKEAEGSKSKGSPRRGRSRDEATIPQRHSSESEHQAANEAGSEKRRPSKSLSPNPSVDRVSRRKDDRGEQPRSRQSPSPIPENSTTPRPPTKVHSYDPSRNRHRPSEDRSVISAAVDIKNYKNTSDPSRGRRPHHRSHHPDDRSVASVGVQRHVGRFPQSQVETTVSELTANMAKLDALQRS